MTHITVTISDAISTFAIIIFTLPRILNRKILTIYVQYCTGFPLANIFTRSDFFSFVLELSAETKWN